jgi:putative RNA 2'-phosphotransferase
MRRQFVHLSVDQESALAVGRRKGPDPVLLEVAALAAYEAGVVFMRGNESTWLASFVPARFLRQHAGANPQVDT